MTEEHLPPRGAFNKSSGREIDAFSIIGTETLDDPEGGRVVQGGIRAFVLCNECNHPRWAREYKEWAQRAYYLLSSQEPKPPEVDLAPGYPAIEQCTFKRVYPGRFIRQALSMLACLSGSSALAAQYPVIRDLVLGKDPRPLPDPLKVHLLLYGDDAARLAGGPQGQAVYDLEHDVLRRVLSFDFPPLALILTVEGPAPEIGVNISSFTQVPIDVRQDVTFEGLQLGFGHKPFPLDYRTRGQILAEGDRLDDASDGA